MCPTTRAGQGAQLDEKERLQRPSKSCLLCERLQFSFSCLEIISEHLQHYTGENQLKKKSFITWSLCCLVNIICIYAWGTV